jgi:hypothetical protein
METRLITGNTYPVKGKLRALGGTWDKRAMGWHVPADKAEEARALVDAAGPVQRDSYRRGRRYGRGGGPLDDAGAVSTYTRFSSGAEVFTNKRGRCEDAPCCGCCS